jgi:hypothetical protein
MNYKELTAPQLLRQWKKLVNDNIMAGRDAHLLKTSLLQYTPCQILVGMFQYKQNSTISIPQFLRQSEEWLLEDEKWAEIELAHYLTKRAPPEYYTYLDLIDEESTYAFTHILAARKSLADWSDKILMS